MDLKNIISAVTQMLEEYYPNRVVVDRRFNYKPSYVIPEVDKDNNFIFYHGTKTPIEKFTRHAYLSSVPEYSALYAKNPEGEVMKSPFYNIDKSLIRPRLYKVKIPASQVFGVTRDASDIDEAEEEEQAIIRAVEFAVQHVTPTLKYDDDDDYTNHKPFEHSLEEVPFEQYNDIVKEAQKRVHSLKQFKNIAINGRRY